MRLYHGTSCENAENIRHVGMRMPSETTLGGARWFTLAADRKSALFHSYGCLVTFEIPKGLPRSEGGKWPGYPYLWPGNDITWDERPTKWYALRQALPPSFVRRVETHRTSRDPDDLRRYPRHQVVPMLIQWPSRRGRER